MVILGIVASVGEQTYEPNKSSTGDSHAPAADEGSGASQVWYASDELANPGAEALAEGGVATRTFTLSLTVPTASDAGYSSFFEFSLEARDPSVLTTAWLTDTTADGFVLDSAEWRSTVQAPLKNGMLEVEDVLPGCLEDVPCSKAVIVTVEATAGDLNAGWYAVFSAEDNTEADDAGDESRAISLEVVTE